KTIAYFSKNVVFLQHNSSADLVRADALLPGCSPGFLKRHKKHTRHFIVDEQKPVRRCLALAQRERFSKVLKHQVNRFRTICTVCGFVALS
ncbi:TPA: hypothetical protein ACFNOY_001519, partial [Neisseria meningitidis]